MHLSLVCSSIRMGIDIVVVVAVVVSSSVIVEVFVRLKDGVEIKGDRSFEQLAIEVFERKRKCNTSKFLIRIGASDKTNQSKNIRDHIVLRQIAQLKHSKAVH